MRLRTLLLIVAAIGFLMAALLWWQPWRARQRIGGWTSAAASLKSLVSINALWHQTDADGNGVNDFLVTDVRSFYHQVDGAGDKHQFIDIGLATADVSIGLVGASPKAGYYFAPIPMDENGMVYVRQAATRFAFCAIPAEYGVDVGFGVGKKTFIVDESGVVYQKDTGGRRVIYWPAADPTTAGWVPAD